MEHKLTGTLIAAAVAGLFLAGQAMATDQPAGTKTATVKCAGANACKGHGACKGAKNECKGHNGCKGQGWEMMSETDCTAKGGHVEK